MDERLTSLGFRVHLAEDEGVWVATARRLDNGDSFGPPVPGDCAEEATETLARWLEWQRNHVAALAALQHAEARYHRLTVEQFASATDVPAREALRSALTEVDERRRQLDIIRDERPWAH